MSEHSKQQAESSSRGEIKRHIRVRGDAGEQSSCAFSLKMPFGKSLCGLKGVETKTHQQKRMTRQVHGWRKDLGDQLACIANETAENCRVCARVRAQRCGSLFD